jgi:hypothetical protein
MEPASFPPSPSPAPTAILADFLVMLAEAILVAAKRAVSFLFHEDEAVASLVDEAAAVAA